MQNNVPFYDGDRLCMATGTLLNTGEYLPAIEWQARQIPTMRTMETLVRAVKESIPGAKVTLQPAVDAGVNVLIDDAGAHKTVTMYALANAYLGAPYGDRLETVRRFVRDLPYDN